MKISVVIPIYNEEENLTLLYEELTEVLTSLDRAYEILFVDDGSRDRTLEIAAELAANDPALRVIEFRANYGQTPAMAAGIEVDNKTFQRDEVV